jgi:hypothetical protein
VFQLGTDKFNMFQLESVDFLFPLADNLLWKNESELHDALKTVDTFSIDVIADRRSKVENPSASNNGGRRDLLSLFIEAGQKLKEKNQLEAASNAGGCL